MRWSRLCANAVAFFFMSVMPAFAALPPATADLAATPMPRLFNSQEIFHGGPSPFKQWNDMLSRTNAEFGGGGAACAPDQPGCALNEWSRFVAILAPLPLREKVIRANAALNRIPYVPTTRNWGRPMYWEAPLEFLAYGGQCQDYAIAKYMALRQAGVPADQMRIVVLRATELGADHAVLVVNIDGDALLLDNLRADVVSANTVVSYRPYYSINEMGWWQHIDNNAVQTAQR
jgi:predicted transglutaminase-like cysteine proteinase